MSTGNRSTFLSTSATRVDLAGGTLDLWPLSALVPNAATINCSIDCMTKVKFTPDETSLQILVKSPDFDSAFEFDDFESFFNSEDSKLTLLQESLSILDDKSLVFGKWEITSESPAGSGLGGSSSLLISILKTLCQISKHKCCDAELIETAKNIESRVLKAPAGVQDYFSPVKQGLNFISYKECGFIREQMVEALSFIGPCLTIVDSKIKHHSGMNNWEILKKFVDGDQEVKKALEQIALISHDLKNALDKKDFSKVVSCFDRELKAREKVSSSYLNAELRAFLKNLMQEPGLKAVKVCGAGGGGCVLVLHQSEAREKIRASLEKKGVVVLPFSLVGS